MLALDSGFLVHNTRTYPHLIRLFAELGVATRDTEMTMSVRCEGCGLEYAGSRGPLGLFPAVSSVARPELPGCPGHGPGFLPGRTPPAPLSRRRTALAGRVPAPGRVPALFRQPLRHPAGGRHLVMPAGGRAGLPGPVPVRVPRPPRDAADRPLSRMAHRHRRFADLRRPDRQAAHDRRGRGAGAGHPAGARRGRSRRRRGYPSLRPRRGRHAPRRGAAPARFPHRRRTGRSRRLPVHLQRGCAAHRRRSADPGPGGPGIVELPAARLRGHGRERARQLPPEPAAGAGRGD